MSYARLRTEAFAGSATGVPDLVHEHGIAIHRVDHSVRETGHQIVPELAFADLQAFRVALDAPQARFQGIGETVAQAFAARFVPVVYPIASACAARRIISL